MTATAPAPIAKTSPVDAVLARIGGRPAGFIKAEAKHLYDDQYRVNIWAQTDAGSRIVHSERVRG